jgi:hypothetical protein
MEIITLLSINIATNQHDPIKLKPINYTTPNISQRQENNRIQGAENKISIYVFIVKDRDISYQIVVMP